MAYITKDSIIAAISDNDLYNDIVDILNSNDHNLLIDFFLRGDYNGENLGIGDGVFLGYLDDDNSILQIFGDDTQTEREYSTSVVTSCLIAAVRKSNQYGTLSTEEIYNIYDEYLEFTRQYHEEFYGDSELGIYRNLDDFLIAQASQQGLNIDPNVSPEEYYRRSVRLHFANEQLIFKSRHSAFSFAKSLLTRVELWKGIVDSSPSNLDDSIDQEEQTQNYEIDAGLTPDSLSISTVPDTGNLDALLSLYAAFEGTDFEDYNRETLTSDLSSKVFIGIDEPSQRDWQQFNRIFKALDVSGISGLNKDTKAMLFEAIESSGLLQLAGYSVSIGDFAKRRFSSLSSLDKLATDYVDAEIDVLWQSQAAVVINNLKQNPIAFTTIQYYFPSLITFLIDTLATIVDYSNNGQGGGLIEEKEEEFINSLERAFGINQETGEAIFTLAFKRNNTNKLIQKAIENSPYRANNAPANPDVFHLRLGAANFYVPPLTIDVNTQFKSGSLVGGAIRQRNTPKFNSGYRETNVSMRLFFPNYEEIWGLSLDPNLPVDLSSDFEINFSADGDSDEKIDKFLSSLRGLVAAFKYSPILPVKNHYLNSVHGITGVCLQSISISTVPNFPFALAVDINLLNFDHQAFLPMIKDFNQSINWGKYRTYMGRAANHLHSYVNENFLIKSSDSKEQDDQSSIDLSLYEEDPDVSLDDVEIVEFDQDILRTNVIDEWRNGNHLSLYVPAETQTKLFLPDTASFRSDSEDMHNDLHEPLWAQILEKYGFDLNQSDSYGVSLSEARDLSLNKSYSMSSYDLVKNSLDILTASVNSQDTSSAIYAELAEGFIIENKSKLDDVRQEWLKQRNDGGSESQDFSSYSDPGPWYFSGKVLTGPDGNYDLSDAKKLIWAVSNDSHQYFEQLIDSEIQRIKTSTNVDIVDRGKIEEDIKRAFNVTLYERFFQNGFVQNLMEAVKDRSGSQKFNEWEVPMLKVDLDPESVIIRGFSLSMGNNFAKMQVQMQDEPTYQFIGGRDTIINMSMTVFGESELIKIKRVFDHVSGLARLEHATGVIGFLGIKNVITALAGVKYVIPMNYQVSTVPNYPHVYQVNLSLVDFDVFQQKREELSNSLQKEMVTEFMTKKNPFLRIKQLWGSFNAYPDFPLYVKDEEGNVVGNLDPDFYFRSFQMYDDDVVYNFTSERPNVESHDFNDGVEKAMASRAMYTYVINSMESILREYDDLGARGVAARLVELASEVNMTKDEFTRVLRSVFNTTDVAIIRQENVLTNLFRIADESVETNIFMEDIGSAPFVVGDLSASDSSALTSIEAALAGEYSLSSDVYENEYGVMIQEVSFHPDYVDFHHVITLLNAVEQDEVDKGRVAAMLQTALGIHFGYISRDNGRFYFSSNGDTVTTSSQESGSSSRSLKPSYPKDIQTPDSAFAETDGPASGVPGVQPLHKYQNAYDGSEHAHWEKMMVDANYRDVSGRMIRAFPTYMLWLIDEGGYFAGVKLFDNFYGLQSIMDFSIVSSEDILGDTLVFRVSNLYSKLTTPESNKIFNPDMGDGEEELSLTQGLAGIVDLILNRSRNILAHMRHEYIVDVNNIRLKPGVRVHLRAGYGSNPNALQTLFNGVITNVEQGEIVTITAQSDAIELGAVVNSTNKNGDSGKIDGGVDTGLYMSEPRDLMIRLLSMGASRTREAIAHATKGVIFSENKFGIRHFGNMLYEPLTDQEGAKHDAIRSAMSEALLAVGNSDMNPLSLAADAAARVGVSTVAGASMIATAGATTPLAMRGFSYSMRGGAISAIGQMIANLNSQIDFEIYKRNIYPGNGTGVAQFLGGDLDDGWASTASISPNENEYAFGERIERDLGFVTDVSWNKLLESYEAGNLGASNSYGVLVSGGEIFEQDSNLTSIGLATAGGAAVGGILGTIIPGAGTIAGASIGSSVGGLLGVLSGKNGENFFRTMGLLSPNPDDDLPGFDEVSFRAQTYMRSVWDVFQTCARLLPNYIVAVRPFEDRSTVFYGKPHWLYTSGVVPVTTGFPGEDRAGLGPKIREPDMDFLNIMDKINAETNPLADYAAFFSSNETSEVFKSLAQANRNGTGIYAPTNHVRGKIINFYDESSLFYEELSGRNASPVVKSALPLARANLFVGPHLPVDTVGGNFGPPGSRISVPISEMMQEGRHQQIVNLVPRYSINVFSDFSDRYEIYGGANILRMTGRYEDVGYDEEDDLFSDVWTKLIEIEKDFLGNDENNPGDEDYKPKQRLYSASGVFNFDEPLALNQLTQISAEVNPLSDSVSITMPFPSTQNVKLTSDIENIYQETGLFEYSSSADALVTGSPTYANIYDEWGSPSTPEDEQFYIAMRWPYEPNIDEEGKQRFKDQYGIEEFFGKAEDYKKRKVLVYSPGTNRAVVCRPAFFHWGTNLDGIRANDGLVSPDAAYYLGIITGTSASDPSGYRAFPLNMPCYVAFVPDEVPVGVISDTVSPISPFEIVGEMSRPIDGEAYTRTFAEDFFKLRNIVDTVDLANHIIGFGNFHNAAAGAFQAYASVNDAENRREALAARHGSSLSAYSATASTRLYDSSYGLQYGGNPYLIGEGVRNFVDAAIQGRYDLITQDVLRENLENEIGDINESQADNPTGRLSFATVYDPTDSISIDARKFYDEDYSTEVAVIGGDGRTVYDAQEIWDQFRYQYHELDSVKQIFANFYGFDPDSEDPFPPFFQGILSGNSDTKLLNPFSATGNSALDEFSLILGADFVDGLYSDPSGSGDQLVADHNLEQAIEYARENFIDAPESQGGIIESINSFLSNRLKFVRERFIISDSLLSAAESGIVSAPVSNQDDESEEAEVLENDPLGRTVDTPGFGRGTGGQTYTDLGSLITTPKQLFLLMVASFRQKMWEDPYARAWLVLKPDLRVGKLGLGARGTRWSLKPVDIIFRAYIDPYNDYAVNNDKFLSLLAQTKGEGNSSGNMFAYAVDSVGDFFSQNVAPIYNAITDSLDGLLSVFKLSSQQMGYALQEASAFRRHANVMNKVFNDSIYYSLGREGSLLRGVDNPFTREYGEPVLEIREPFQKLHYISSFSHILSNQIQENLNNVATVITGISDGKYPVTVALDKGAPAERQVEKTIETGIYFDNAIGTGVLGIIHPIMHPFETFRGISKNVQGTPDELTARRIALAHLKENIKDIYQGELIVIGNPDIRPHDLVYLSDVYERMYGMFEVEQVVHNFTPELGFTTSITPNALVTVNDPARWFLTSWIHSWFSKMAIRNDARVLMDRAKAGSSGMSLGGQVSMDRLAQILEPQIIGGMQFTHGSSALVKDAVAMKTAQAMPDVTKAMNDILGSNTSGAGGAAAIASTATGMIVGGVAAALGSVAAPFTAGTSLAVGAALSSAVTQLAWKGWSWVRDNLLDQHGCYVQYLSKNGQPMDAGLSYNQGMVVGKHHSKALLPGVLGVRRKVRTVDGHAYIRTDDLLKSMGWKEVEIDTFVRYASYENALVHARVLRLAGLSPEQASLSNVFKVLARIVEVKGGDYVRVEDIISGHEFDIKLDGIETERVNEVGVRIDSSLTTTEQDLMIADATVPSSRSALFVAESLKDKIFILRINETREPSTASGSTASVDSDYEAGSRYNKTYNYQKDGDNTVATLFYHLPNDWIYSTIRNVSDLLRKAGVGVQIDPSEYLTDNLAQNIADQLGVTIEDVYQMNWSNLPGAPSAPVVTSSDFISVFKSSLDTESVFYARFDAIYNSIDEHFSAYDFYELAQITSSDSLYGISDSQKKQYSNIVAMALLNKLYLTISEWPRVSWDQYHEDGVPYSLNWEMVTRNLAEVRVSDLLKESPSAVTAAESAMIPEINIPGASTYV